MYNLETIGLILLFGLILLGGGLYLKLSKTQPVKKELLPLGELPGDKFEAAVEFLPDFNFPPEPVIEGIPELPWGYSDDKLTAMVRDPEWIFVYWDISESKRESLRGIHGPDWDRSVPVLRVYDVTDLTKFDGTNASRYFDVSVDDRAGSWYVHVGAPNRQYCIDLGKILGDSTFVIMARSNFVTTPRNAISDKTDPDWMLVSENERKLLARMGHTDSYSSEDLFKH